MNEYVVVGGLVLLSYLFGSIPFGIIISRLYKVDITKVGSGNVGATNVLRALGPFPAALVFVGDFAKGVIPVYLATFLNLEPLFIISAGLAAIVGHSFSIFLKFRGGRGVATGLGVLLGVAPDVFLLVIILAAIIIGFTRYVSLASVTGSVVAAASMYFFDKPMPYVIVTAMIALLIVIRHIPNIKRLVRGEERKIGEKIQ